MESLLLASDITKLWELNENEIDRVGDCANLERKVNVSSFLWETLTVCDGWALQKDRLTKRTRIVDENGIQKANGSLLAMKEKMVRLLSPQFLKPGDVVGTSRGAYEHYAIYIGNGKVIHYAGATTDFGEKITIHEAPFEEFTKKNKNYFVVSFTGKHPIKLQSSTNFITNSYFGFRTIRTNKVYSAAETIQRAYSRLGETNYNLVTNNCEHFALWCKTGKATSSQVNAMAQYLVGKAGGIST